ncbi:Reverse transcriptase domain [Trinorchestia longiramus]|nr:Reverse transcriptase domain [Trinorchestia longiramus]
MALRKKINETKRKHFQKNLQTAKKNPKRTWEIKEIAQYRDIKEEKKFENTLETATNFNTFFSEVRAKVFDELLQKISTLGIATQWFQSYLANRSHAVRLENTISSPIQNDFGVPQDSILGPLLFSIFINDFPSMPSNTRISMYADDVQIAMTSALAKLSQTKSNAEILLKHVKSWYDQYGLKLNASKTQCISFGSKNTIKKLPNVTLTLGNDIIEPVGEIKNLGVWFDQNMSFTSHVEKTCSKINGTLMFLHRVKNMLDEKTRLLAIQSLVFSRFDYCDLVWGDKPKGLQKELQKCMNFAAKVVCKGNFRKNDHAIPLMKKLNWNPIEQRLLIHKVKYLFSSLYRPQRSANVVKFHPPTNMGVKLNRRHDVNISFRSFDAGQRTLSISGLRCDHNIVTEYYIESLTYTTSDSRFLARPARNYHDYCFGRVQCGDTP